MEQAVSIITLVFLTPGTSHSLPNNGLHHPLSSVASLQQYPGSLISFNLSSLFTCSRPHLTLNYYHHIAPVSQTSQTPASHAPLFPPHPCHASGTCCCGTRTTSNSLRSHSYIALKLGEDITAQAYIIPTNTLWGFLCLVPLQGNLSFHSMLSTPQTVIFHSTLCLPPTYLHPILNPSCQSPAIQSNPFLPLCSPT